MKVIIGIMILLVGLSAPFCGRPVPQTGLYHFTEILRDYIKRNTAQELIYFSEYNLYFFMTPLDCAQCEHAITDRLIREIKSISGNNELRLSLHYILSGDFSRTELEHYIYQIDHESYYYFDTHNQMRPFLFANFNTLKTPLVLILDQNGRLKFWHNLSPDFTTADLIKTLNLIL